MYGALNIGPVYMLPRDILKEIFCSRNENTLFEACTSRVDNVRVR